MFSKRVNGKYQLIVDSGPNPPYSPIVFFFHKLHENAWTNYASCKTMWAGAELYRQTGEKIFADTAIRILDYYCDTQSPSGSWVHTLWYEDSSSQTLAWSADITFEYIAEISDVLFDFCSC